MRTRQVQSAPEVLVIITHRITARAASALGVGECRAAHRLHSHLQAYSGVGRQTHAAGRQAELPSGREDPPVLDFIPRGPWWGWERPRRMQEACACGAVHQGAARHMGMRAWPVKTALRFRVFSFPILLYSQRPSWQKQFPPNPTC